MLLIYSLITIISIFLLKDIFINYHIDNELQNELDIYSEVIFNIEKRFVGEEPTDNVTRQYNEEMKKRLPAYGVELIEIPRKTSGDTIISAGLVRRYLKEGQMDLIRSLVPDSTWEYLCK